MFFEDVVVGETVQFGSHLFTAEEIVAFASRYDPQSFHMDEEAARTGPFGRLAASGWHTAAIWMKLNVAARQAEEGSGPMQVGPSPGFKSLKWIVPVFAGDTLSFASCVTGKRVTSKPDWGLVFSHCTGHKADGTVAFSFEGCVLWRRRPAADLTVSDLRIPSGS
ncbi:MaoC family dehydratase [Lichenihabitans sp. PAMC28606]|uniref:MaoC family dehydratase n=1 Tax=Lichenihabitans sp. PAMC28606 TaxID=2880932 RepID=UPI001D0A0EB9|nr:MaoC family dehydratase [Lichenihabitans sp. PAMC28606]UDL95872.1 MaoC family dehydratase [Lichenihabitans sp. PAMC28606]